MSGLSNSVLGVGGFILVCNGPHPDVLTDLKIDTPAPVLLSGTSSRSAFRDK